MEHSRLRPRVVLWWGIALTATGTVLTLFLPNLTYLWMGNGATGVDQGILTLLDTLLRATNAILPFLGAALIGASVVMFYLERALLIQNARAGHRRGMRGAARPQGRATPAIQQQSGAHDPSGSV